MSQVQVSNSNCNSNSNRNIDTNQTSIQELLNLVKSLYKIIEGLNARLEKFESEGESLPKNVGRGISDDVNMVVSFYSLALKSGPSWGPFGPRQGP